MGMCLGCSFSAYHLPAYVAFWILFIKTARQQKVRANIWTLLPLSLLRFTLYYCPPWYKSQNPPYNLVPVLQECHFSRILLSSLCKYSPAVNTCVRKKKKVRTTIFDFYKKCIDLSCGRMCVSWGIISAHCSHHGWSRLLCPHQLGWRGQSPGHIVF